MKNYVQTLASDIFPLLSLSIMIFSSLAPYRTSNKKATSSKGVIALSGLVEVTAKNKIAGISDGDIYLWNGDSTTLSGYDMDMNKFKKQVFDKISSRTYAGSKVVADSSLVYIYNAAVRGIFAFERETGETKWLKFYHKPFAEMIPVAPDYVVLRIAEQPGSCKFVKCPVKDFSKGSFTIQVNGKRGISGGTMLYDGTRQKLFYVYDEEFLCLDKNMKLEYRTKCTKNSGKHRQCCLSRGFLYIMASANLIDVYDINNGHYCFSFQVPAFIRDNIRDFRISNNRLFALYDKFLISYAISL